MDKKQIGKIGEDIACKYLEKNNYKIIERNFNTKLGEIDIIVKDKETEEIVFIEVKTRNNKKFGRGLESIDDYKMNHIINTAKYYLYKNKLNTSIRFDAIEINMNQKKINHIKQIV